MLLCSVPHEILSPWDNIACCFGNSVLGNVSDRHISTIVGLDPAILGT